MKPTKKSSLYECQHCGWQSSKWVGKCPNCDSWESLVELNKAQIQHLQTNTKQKDSKPIPITQIQEESLERFSSTQSELDIVLGGGIVKGGLYLVGGSPGIGKSTLLLKIAGDLAKNGKKILYVSGEESLSQIYNRAKRCHCLSDLLFLLSEINIMEIKENILNTQFEVCIIDSIQTMYSPNLTAAPGSVSQVREITFELMRMAKNLNIAVFIIGHITKDGQLAGPRVLEHMVDCVLYFEGEKNSELKILRGFKNRFGTTSEIGIFEMKEYGLVSANEATKKFFNKKRDMPGSAAVAICEGSRCLVVEIQALTFENEFGVPKRLANGFDTNRLNMILALLEKKLGIMLHRHDVFVNVAGGIKISETSADLALIASILSSYKNRVLKASTAFLGEVSLIGDIREIGSLEMRLKELENFGFTTAIVPNTPKGYKGNVKCIPVYEVAKIIDWM